MQEERNRGGLCFDMYGSHQLLASSHPEGTRQNVVEGHSLWRSVEWVLAE